MGSLLKVCGICIRIRIDIGHVVKRTWVLEYLSTYLLINEGFLFLFLFCSAGCTCGSVVVLRCGAVHVLAEDGRGGREGGWRSRLIRFQGLGCK